MSALAAVRSDAVRELDGEALRQLADIGLYAAFNGQPARALALFDALGRLRLEGPAANIGHALAVMAAGRPEQAARELEAALARFPADREVRVFLGLALRLAGRGHLARTILAPLAVETGVASGRLARHLMDARW